MITTHPAYGQLVERAKNEGTSIHVGEMFDGVVAGYIIIPLQSLQII